MNNDDIARRLYEGCDNMTRRQMLAELDAVNKELAEAAMRVAKLDAVKSIGKVAAYWKNRAEALSQLREDLLDSLDG